MEPVNNMITEYEIDLALMNASPKKLREIRKNLSADYTISDQSENGWGLVVGSCPENRENSLDKQVNSFLSEVLPIKEWIKKSSSVLRIAVYTSSVTSTLRLSDFGLIDSLNLELEISVYPVAKKQQNVHL